MAGGWLWTSIARAATCGDVLTADTTLTGDLVCAADFTGSALTLAADGITLDGDGHAVILAGEGTAVVVSGFASVTVRNVDLSGTGGRGVLATDADLLTLEDLDVSGRAEGIRAAGRGVTLRRIDAHDSRGWAVALSGDRPVVEDLVTDGSAGGLSLDRVTGFRPTSAPSLRGTRFGVHVQRGRDVALDGWTFDGIDGVAVTIDGCDDCSVSASSFVGARAGIDVRQPHARLEVVGNDLSGIYGGWALSVRGGVDDRIAGNLLDGAILGIRLAEAQDVDLAADNTFGAVGHRAVWVEDSVGVQLTGLSLAGFDGTAITLLRCTDCGVHDSVLAGVGGGIEAVASDRVMIDGNDLQGARRFGLRLADSADVTPQHNVFDGAIDGLVLDRSFEIAVDATNSLCGAGLVIDGVLAAGATAPDADGDGILDACDACQDPDRDGACGADDPCIGVAVADTDADGWCADTDCDDASAAVHPGATEATCNGIDDDCEPATGDSPDDDRDGILACADCDDHDAAAFPGAPEVCNGRDDDCDTHVDDGLPSEAWFADADGDSYGGEAPVFTCDGPPAGHVGNHADCDDNRASAHPGARETLHNGVDDDCNRFTSDDNDDAT